MNENNLPQNVSEENIEMIFNTIKYCANNPLMLIGFSICGLVMATCVILDNKYNKKEND